MTSSPATPNFIPAPTPGGHLAPCPPSLFAARADRLRELADTAVLADWLRFIAHLADAQAGIQRLLGEDIRAAACLDAAGHLDLARLPALSLWQHATALLAERIVTVDNPAAAKTAHALLALDADARAALALRILRGETRAEDLHAAPLARAALELLATGAAALACSQIHTNIGETCPVCAGPALAATLEASPTGPTSGPRYLHCAHCNTAWRHVRAQCTHCHSAAGLSYQSLEQGPDIPAWRAETCDACQAYLKIFDRTKAGKLDPVADDLASLELDLALGTAGYRRAGANPYLLLGEHAED